MENKKSSNAMQNKVPRSTSLPTISYSGKNTHSSASSSTCDSNESISEKVKVSDHVRRKLVSILGSLRSRHRRTRPKSNSHGDFGRQPEVSVKRLEDKRHMSLPTDCLPMVIVREYRHEGIYRGLIRSLLHPLGVPEGTIGLRPGDLLDHLREVFDVEREDHEAFIREELSNTPQNLQVNLTVLEANGLRGPNFTEDTCNSYCVIQLHNPAKGKNVYQNLLSPRHTPSPSPRQSPAPSRKQSPLPSPKHTPTPSPKYTPMPSPRQTPSPKSSPSASPFISPKCPHKGLVVELPAVHQGVQRTSVLHNSSQPKWNEEFQIDIEDFLTDEVHVYVYDQEFTSSDSKEEKQNSLKSFLGKSKSSSTEHDSIGKIVIPVRNISSMGTDEWYEIVAPGTSKGKPKPVGKCHLRLGISYKHDCEGNFYFSTEDYYKAFKQFLNYTYSDLSRHPSDQYGQLSLKAHRILKMFAEAHSISKLSQAIVNVICLLEIHCERDSAEMSEYHINTALDDLRMTWATMQIGQKSILDRMPLTDTELSNYRRVASRFIQQKGQLVSDLPKLFPPTTETLNVLKAKLGVVVQLLGLDLWEPKCHPQQQISGQMLEKLQEDVSEWITAEIEKIPETHPDIKDKVIPEIQRLVDLVNTISCHCNLLPVNKHFYNCLGVNYYKVISMAAEKKISALSMSTIQLMNKYKKRYNSFSVNIMAASKLSLALYFALRKLCNIVRDNVTRRELFRLAIFHYQEWFEEAMIHWLQTFRTECINRLEKAIEIEKDVVVVTSLVKYSHSSVDVLSCFAQVIGEWKKIDFRDADCALMGVTNITDIICDGARMYADKVHTILKRNCYFDDNLNAEFDVNDRLCITINNIEHVRMYLGELPRLLSWDLVVMALSTMHDSEDIGRKAMDTLQRLIYISNKEILMKSSLLLRQIAEKMRVDMEKYMEIFTKREPYKASSVDQFLGYVSTNMHTLNEQLMPDIYPYMTEQLWNVILQSLHNQLLLGQKTEYYEHIKQHLRALGSFFQRIARDDVTLHSELYNELKERLDLNSRKSEDLMLSYYKDLTMNMSTPPECYGHLAFKAAYIEETRGNMTVYVTVLRGSDLPGLDSSGYSDPYVEVSLQPQAMFAWSRSQRTHVVKQTLNPVFNVTFQFPNISKEYLNTQGSCILLTVYDHDTIGWDDFAGEVVVHIPSLPKITVNNSMDKIPAIIMPLKRPQKQLDGPFSILSKREWDRPAKTFVADRLRFMEHQPTRTDKRPSQQGIFSSFFSSVFN